MDTKSLTIRLSSLQIKELDKLVRHPTQDLINTGVKSRNDLIRIAIGQFLNQYFDESENIHQNTE